MAYMCIKNFSKECDGCMACKPERNYYCPVCGDEVAETVYVAADGEVVGCDGCIHTKDPEDMIDEA